MISNGCVIYDDFVKLLVQIGFLEDATNFREDKLYALVNHVNKKLKKFNMMIRPTPDELDKNCPKYFVLISTVDNDITRAAHSHTPKQYEFFKLLLNEIVANPRGIIKRFSIDEFAIQATLSTKVSRTNRNLAEHEMVFSDWCFRKWFVIVREEGEEFITLGVRSLAELDVFIKQKLVERSEDLDCKNCKTMSIYSKICDKCEARFHMRCAKLKFKDPDATTCKSCSEEVAPEPRPSTSTNRRRSAKSRI